jgi:protein kinase C substrate 80K-H
MITVYCCNVFSTWNSNKNAQWESSFKAMEYSNGLRCWGGPDRSTKVEVFCDGENRISEPQEPNKCEYSLKFYTPAACNEAHSLALQKELEAALGPITHDEL